MKNVHTARLPGELVELVLAEFDSVPEIEALVLLAESAAQSWSTEQVSERLYLPVRATDAILAKLARKGFVSVGDQGMVFFDEHGRHAARLGRLVAAYRQHTGLLSRLVHSKGSPALQDFLRAFDVKREK